MKDDKEEHSISWYTYTPKVNTSLHGIPLLLPRAVMSDITLSVPTDVTLQDDNVLRDFVFVTAASSDFHRQALAAIGSVHTYWPNQKIYYYDLGGHSRSQIRMVRWDIVGVTITCSHVKQDNL